MIKPYIGYNHDLRFTVFDFLVEIGKIAKS